MVQGEGREKEEGWVPGVSRDRAKRASDVFIQCSRVGLGLMAQLDIEGLSLSLILKDSRRFQDLLCPKYLG